MALVRLVKPVTYYWLFLDFYGCPHNLISHEQSPWVWVLVGYVVLQAFILLLQDRLGPRFFIPEKVPFSSTFLVRWSSC